jgi:hypothetical protein
MSQRYHHNAVKYNDNLPYRLPQPVDTGIPPVPEHPETDEVCHYIAVSSSYRNATNYPKHYDYRINLNEPLYDVIKAEMIACTFPNSADILDEPALVIDIEELNFIKCQNTSQTTAFTIVPLKGPNKASAGFINPELSCTVRGKYCKLESPKGVLSSLTIKVRNIEGVLYDFGSPSGSTSKALQHSFVLKIVTKVAKNQSSYLRNF